MLNVRLPTDDLALANKIQRQMLLEDGTYLVVFRFDGKCFTRLSAQIYNSLADYEYAAYKFLERLNAENLLSSEPQKKRRLE